MTRLPFLCLAFAAMAILAAICIPFSAYGQPQCAPRTEQLSYLKEKYGESPVATGTSGRSGLLIVTANKDTGTWSILFQSGNGPACFRGSGDGWRTLKPQIGTSL